MGNGLFRPESFVTYEPRKLKKSRGVLHMNIEPLPQGFGAEVKGFDVLHGCSPAEVATLRAAYSKWNLLIFRNCGVLPPERQVEITGWFGKIGANADSQGRPWTVLHNDNATGSALLPFHSDITFFAHPLEGISLHPQALPHVETSTTFISNAVAWDALSPDLQREVRDLRARHYYDSSAEMGMDWPILEYWHPVRLEHPKTGRPLLFVTEHHVNRISEVSESRSAELLSTLFATLYAPERRYEHVWHLGELVIWDNLAIQHARTRESAPSEGVRALQRVAIGEYGFLEQLRQVQAQASTIA
jgi:taurine dioxygenase